MTLHVHPEPQQPTPVRGARSGLRCRFTCTTWWDDADELVQLYLGSTSDPLVRTVCGGGLRAVASRGALPCACVAMRASKSREPERVCCIRWSVAVQPSSTNTAWLGTSGPYTQARWRSATARQCVPLRGFVLTQVRLEQRELRSSPTILATPPPLLAPDPAQAHPTTSRAYGYVIVVKKHADDDVEDADPLFSQQDYFLARPVRKPYQSTETGTLGLRHCRRVVTLELRYNRLGPNGAAMLADALRHNSSLVTLSVSSNMIGDAGWGSEVAWFAARQFHVGPPTPGWKRALADNGGGGG